MKHFTGLILILLWLMGVVLAKEDRETDHTVKMRVGHLYDMEFLF